METTVLMRDKNLETMAKAIFGESLVEAAYVATWSYDCTQKEIRKRLKEAAFIKVSDEIRQDAKTIAITFSSGNTVEFTNSEWGAMAKIDLDSPDISFMEKTGE